MLRRRGVLLADLVPVLGADVAFDLAERVRLKPPQPRPRSCKQRAAALLAAIRYRDDGAIPARTWEEVVAQLRARHQGDARAAVYPYCAIQHVETGLDETTEHTAG